MAASMAALACLPAVAAAGPTPAQAAAVAAPVPEPEYAKYDRYPVEGRPLAVAIGDFTGDGRTDVAVATGVTFNAPTDSKVWVFAQAANGQLEQRATFDTHNGSFEVQALTAADVDGDGDTDLLFVGWQGIDLFVQAAGSLQPGRLLQPPHARDADVADLNGDGLPDLVVSTSDGTFVLRGLGGAAFGPPTRVTEASFVEVDLGDVTGDGVKDLVGYTTIKVHVLAGEPGGTFGPPAGYDIATGYWPDGDGLVTGDFTGDGRSDVAVTIGGNSPGSRLNVFPQQADGKLGPPQVTPAYEMAGPIEAADMNLDGRLDLVVGFSGWGFVGVFTQMPDGTLSIEAAPSLPGSGYQTGGLAVGDVNGDAIPDIVVADYYGAIEVMRSAGQIKAWGLGMSGQLGNGTTANAYQAGGAITGLPDVAVASAGGYHNVVAARDGSVWTWGLNNAGQLGDGTTTSRSRPVRVPGLTGVVAVAGGTVHSVAVRSDGTVWTWGWNAFGQLGLGTTASRSTPAQVPGLTNVVAVAAGLAHTLALTADGSVWAWGLGHVGQLGDRTTNSSTTPVRIAGLSSIEAISAGTYHNLALAQDGRVWAWGLNTSGQLGTGSAAIYETSPQASLMEDAVQISAGAFHSVAKAYDGWVWGWGQNTEGELGDTSYVNRPRPDVIGGTDGVKTVAAGWYHTVAVLWNGQTRAWGWNYFGQLGTGDTATQVVSVPVPAAQKAVLVTAGVAHTLVLTSRGD